MISDTKNEIITGLMDDANPSSSILGTAKLNYTII